MHKLKIFVVEFVAIDRFSTRPIVICEVSSLIVQVTGVRLDPGVEFLGVREKIRPFHV